MTISMKNMLPRKDSKYTEGYYSVINKDKYLGDLKKVIYRSSYELELFKQLDLDKDVLYWVAEPPQLRIKYYNPVKKRWSNYFPDVFCVKLLNGKKIKMILEIKPKSKLVKPKKPNTNDQKKLMSYDKKMQEYSIIDQKRRSAVEFAKSRGMEYIFITENTVKKRNNVSSIPNKNV